MMAIRCGVTIDRLVGCFAAMSSRLVCEPRCGMPFVMGVKVIKYSLTEMGRDYVAKNWGKETIDLETL